MTKDDKHIADKQWLFIYCIEFIIAELSLLVTVLWLFKFHNFLWLINFYNLLINSNRISYMSARDHAKQVRLPW